MVILHQGVETASESGLKKAQKLRRNTRKLVEAFSEISDRYFEPLRSELQQLAADLSKEERIPRDNAIHGAWTKAPARGYLVSHSGRLTHQHVDHQEGGIVIREFVDDSEIDFALRYVDQLLRRMMEAHDRIIKEERPPPESVG